MLNLRIIRTKATKLTKANVVIDLKNIPIIPPIFDPNPYTNHREANYNKFMMQARTLSSHSQDDNHPNEIQKAYRNLDSEERESNINGSADLIMSYILGEVAKRYSIAKEHKEFAITEQLKGLKFIKSEGFDLDMFDLVLRTPGGLKNMNGEPYLTVIQDGKSINFFPTDAQIDDYKYNQHMRDHCFDAGRYYVHRLSQDLELYSKEDPSLDSAYPSEPIQ